MYTLNFTTKKRKKIENCHLILISSGQKFYKNTNNTRKKSKIV